jgi:hypothetical protein
MSIYDLVKDAATIAQKANNFELYKLLLDVQKESLDLVEENRKLKEEIRSLKDNSYINETLIFKNNCYFKKDDVELNEPYCSKCWDDDKKLIRLHINDYYGASGLTGTCHRCKTDSYNIKKK